MGKYGVSYLKLLVFQYECWAGLRLLPEKTVPWTKRAERIVEVPTAPVSEEVFIRLGCQLIGSLFRGLDTLEKIILCGLGCHFNNLRHFGWLH